MSQRIAILGAGVMGETLLSAILTSGHPVDRPRHQREARRAGRRAARDVRRRGHRQRRGRRRRRRRPAGRQAPGRPDAARRDRRVGAPGRHGRLAGRRRPHRDDRGRAARRRRGRSARCPTPRHWWARGCSASRPAAPAHAEQLAAVVRLLESGGKVVVGRREPQQDAVTAVSGSGPAYVFYLAEAMIAGGVAEGLDPDDRPHAGRRRRWSARPSCWPSPTRPPRSCAAG